MDFESIKSILEFAGLGMDFMFPHLCIGFGYGFWKSGYGFCYFGKSIPALQKSKYGFCKVVKSIPEKQNPYWGSSRGVNFGRKRFFKPSTPSAKSPRIWRRFWLCAPFEAKGVSGEAKQRTPRAERKYTKIHENPYLTFKIRTCLQNPYPHKKLTLKSKNLTLKSGILKIDA